MEIGEQMMRGLAIGIDSNYQLVRDAMVRAALGVTGDFGMTISQKQDNLGITIKQGVDDFGMTISQGVQDYGMTISQGVENYGITIQQGIDTALEPLPATIETMFYDLSTQVTSHTESVTKDGAGIGEALALGIGTGFNNKWPSIIADVMGKVSTLIAQIRAALDIHSPSGVFQSIGEQMMAGMALGIQRGGGLVLGAMNDVLGGVIPRGGFGTMPVLNPGGWSVANGSAAGGDGGFGTMPVRNAGGYTIIVNAGIGTDGRSVGRHVVDVLNEELGLDRRATSWAK
jgi:hypothetical protein